MIYCKDCKHFDLDDRYFMNSYCKRPYQPGEAAPDYTGLGTLKPYVSFISVERRDDGSGKRCGPEARFFEPK